jgi:tetratricopeptide (TPR) repeat protein
LPPLVGRERELEMIDELLEEAAAGAAQALFIRGEAGIGKSLLAEHMLASAEVTYGSMALLGRSYELDAPISYRPIRQMLEQVSVMAPERVEEALRSSIHLRRLLPNDEASARTVADPALLQIELFDEVVRLLARLATVGRPLAMLFDDVHAADEASLVFLHHLCRRLHEAETPALVLATYRADEVAARANRPLAQLLGGLRRDGLLRELALEPLADAFMRLLVERQFGTQPVERPLVDTVIRQAEGNPLFAGELVRTLVDEGRARHSDGQWRLWANAGAAQAVPVAIHELLDRRLERLGPAARQVLQTAAIVASDIDFGLLRQVVPLSERDILDGLDECLQTAVLEETPAGYRYRHGLLREAAYARLSRARRQQLHRSVAEALALLSSSEPAVIGAHFEQSDEPWRAVPHLGLAAHVSGDVFDNQHAIELYDRALALSRAHLDKISTSQIAALLEELGDLVRRTGDLSRSAVLFEEALAHLAAAGEVTRAFGVGFKAALSHIHRGDVDAAARLITNTLQPLAEAHPDRVLVGRTYYLLAQLRWHSGQPREALHAAEAAVQAAQVSQDATERARAHEVMGLACHSLGEWQKGLEYELTRDGLQVPGYVDDALEMHL